MNRGAWRATVYGVTKSWTRLVISTHIDKKGIEFGLGIGGVNPEKERAGAANPGTE